jgi:glycosyltransferase involved in cell wall biosynthesis
VELARFLGRSGYDVRHIYARFPDWGIGSVESELNYPSEALEFDTAEWHLDGILARYRHAVDDFDPDRVIITDSWNIKPLLAQAVQGYPYILRLQALECLCPLNNLRLLLEEDGEFRQCPLHQFATPERCAECVAERGHRSGALHQAERALCGVGSAEYHDAMLRAFAEAEAVLVVNPLHEAILSPFARDVRVVTAGMDPTRFSWIDGDPAERRESWAEGRSVLLFAGLVDEPMKGFAVLHEACRRLWTRAGRQDFVLAATADPPGQLDDFTQFVGWKQQDDLPRLFRMADIVVFPTVAQEALGRTAVEAMAASRAVIASRIGGLPFTVADGATGLLCEPADADDLANKIETLLDDSELRLRLGQAGRRRFEECYSWDVIIERHYRPLLKRRERARLNLPGQRASGMLRPATDSMSGRPAPSARLNSQSVRAKPRTANDYEPAFRSVDQDRLFEDTGCLFNLSRDEVERRWRTYRTLHEAKGYERSLGEFKTLCLEEAFVLSVAMAEARPRTIVEVGTQHGKSTRRILDIACLLELNCRVVCFDIANSVRHFKPSLEAELILGDLTGRFRRDVLGKHNPGLIYLDVHTNSLLTEAVTETLAHPSPCVLAIHDCGRNLCNPLMTISKDDPNVTSSTGVWERHVLAEAFGVADPLDPRLDALETPMHRLKIFNILHGLGVLYPKSLTK